MSEVEADPHAEAARVMTVCNSCRYCEGICAVFPAMEMRAPNFSRATSITSPICAMAAAPFITIANTRRRMSSPSTFPPPSPAVRNGKSYRSHAWPAALVGPVRRQRLFSWWRLSRFCRSPRSRDRLFADLRRAATSPAIATGPGVFLSPDAACRHGLAVRRRLYVGADRRWRSACSRFWRTRHWRRFAASCDIRPAPPMTRRA